jgi:hypothetical protein
MQFEYEHYSIKIKRFGLKQKTVIFSGMIMFEIPLLDGGIKIRYEKVYAICII